MLPWLPSIYASFESKYSVTSGGLCKEFLESFLYFVYGFGYPLYPSLINFVFFADKKKNIRKNMHVMFTFFFF